MRIFVNVKQIGTRKSFIAREEINLGSKPSTLRQLIEIIVSENVRKFNDKAGENTILGYLTDRQIDEKLSAGKVSFGGLNNSTKAGLNKSLECAFQAYEDGIYRVLVNETECGALDELLDLKDGDVLTFVRLTMLAGRMW